MTRRGRFVVGGVLAVGMLLIVIIGAGSSEVLDPDSTNPDGAKALVMLLEEYATPTRVLEEVPGPEVEVAVLLVDRLDVAASAALDSWVFEGGVLVVTDPGSPFVPQIAGVGSSEDDGLPEIGRGSCNLGELGDLSGVELVSVRGAILYDNTGSDGHCFGDRAASFVDLRRRGDGVVISIGGGGGFGNDLLDEADNSVMAVALMAPTSDTAVAVLRRSLRSPEFTPTPAPDGSPRRARRVGDGSQSLFDLMPEYMRWVALDLALAWLVYVLAKSRRLGRPIPDHQPVKIAGSELVLARGRLLGRLGQSATVDHLVVGFRTDLSRTLGLPPNVPDQRLAEIAESRSELEADAIMRVLKTVDVSDDRELVEFARLLDQMCQEVQDD